MPIKLGMFGIKTPYSKIYLGKKLKYQKKTFELIEFSSCPFPTSWTQITAGKRYYASNTYGKWYITSNSCLSSVNRAVYKAFDNDLNTSWRSAELTGNDYSRIQIDCPKGIAIKPVSIYINYGTVSSLTIEGYNIETKEWEIFNTFSTGKLIATKTITLSTNNYYSSFRCKGYKYTGYSTNIISELQIQSGIIRKEL